MKGGCNEKKGEKCLNDVVEYQVSLNSTFSPKYLGSALSFPSDMSEPFSQPRQIGFGPDKNLWVAIAGTTDPGILALFVCFLLNQNCLIKYYYR